MAQPIAGLQPSPVQAHTVFAISSDGITDNHRGNGAASNIDASGDSIQGNLTVGIAPAHAGLTRDGTRLYVANSAEDSVTANNTSAPTTVAATVSVPASATAMITQVMGGGGTATYMYTGTTQVFSIGDLVFVSGCATPGFNGVFTVTMASVGSFSVSNPTTATDNPELAGAQAKAPNAVFVNTAENGNVYVAGYGTNSVYVINTTTNVVSATVPIGTPTVPAGAHPVAIAELPNAQQVYVADQGSSANSVPADVKVISTTDDTVTQTIPLPVGANPVWAVAKSDSSRVYVLDENGTIYDLNPALTAINCSSPPSATCTSTTSIGTGTNFLTYDPVINRLYVTNPTNSQIGILDASVDPPKLLNTIDLSTAAASVCSGCAPDEVTVLGDGSRAYVAGYQFSSGCTDTAGNAVNCVNSFVAVIDGLSGTLKSVISPIGSAPALATTGCGLGAGPAPSVWQPGTTRFRVSIASSGGGVNSRFKVYVGQCDAGSVAVIDTFAANGNPADAFTGLSLPAPASTFPPLASGVPPTENPVLLLAGP